MYKTCILLFWSAVALSNTMFYEETVLSAEENGILQINVPEYL